jgi:hypothetical protein
MPSLLPLLTFSLLCAALTHATEPQRDSQSTPPLSPTSNQHVAIPRTSFGKEFLLSGSIIPQFTAATSHGLAGKIVRFELFHDGVDLYEAHQGILVTDDLPARRLITTFPIIHEDDHQVVIDFNRGMRRVFTDVWYSLSPSFNAASLSRSLELPQSRVFEVRSEHDRLVIRQSAQARNRDFDSNREERYEIRYFLSLYQPTASTIIKEINPSHARYLRFFQTHPLLEPTTGRSTSPIARFDISQPVVFYYSSNTPDDYVSAVRDGILYWNRAFGRDILRAEPAPHGLTAPDARHNIIQWVPFDNAGSAYADVLVDPRTGASQHGQAYVTSVFAINGRARARELLRTLSAAATASDPGAHPNPNPHQILPLDPNFFPSSSVCQMDHGAFARQFSAGLETMLSDVNADDQAVLRASQDYVREVVAHEVGHILGLRHNFGGSIEATLSHKQLDDWFRKYLAGEDPPLTADTLPSSSIMDYLPFTASVLFGAWIRTVNEALPHDRAAIRWGYFDSPDAIEKRLLFATDQDASSYGDVQVFDYGAEPVVNAYLEIAEQLKLLPNSVIEAFIQAKAPRNPSDQRPLEEVNLNVSSHASRFASIYNRILLWFRASTRSLKVEGAFDYVGELNRKDVLQAHWNALNHQIDRLGGIDRTAFAFLPLDLKLDLGKEPQNILTAEKIEASKLLQRLKQLLDSPAYSTFVGLDDQTYSFTADEKKLILERGNIFFTEFEKTVVKLIAQTFERANRDLALQATGIVGDDDIVSKLEQRIIDLSKAIIMAKDDSKRRRGRVDKSLVEVVEFKYDHDTRLAAARALNDNIGTFRGWAADAKSTLNKQLKDDVEAALNIQRFKDFQESILSRPLREWYLNQQAILALLPPRRSSSESTPAQSDSK